MFDCTFAMKSDSDGIQCYNSPAGLSIEASEGLDNHLC